MLPSDTHTQLRMMPVNGGSNDQKCWIAHIQTQDHLNANLVLSAAVQMIHQV